MASSLSWKLLLPRMLKSNDDLSWSMKFILSLPVYLVSSGHSFTYQWWATIYNFHKPEFNCAFIWQFGVVVESYILQNNVIFVNVYNLYNYTLQTGVQGDIKKVQVSS